MSTTENIKRPHLLTWLCIGSAIFGIAWIIMFTVLIIYSLEGEVPAGLFPGIVIEYLKVGYSFVIAEILFTAVGLFAVGMMWKMKKSGFFLYASIKILLYFLPIFFLGSGHLAFFPLAVTSTVIVGYGITLRSFE